MSYSYETGNAWNPVRGRLHYQIALRLWVAGGVQFDSGLPSQFQCDPSLILDQCIAGEVQTYGKQVIDRVNFLQGRIDPTFQVSASAGAEVYKSDRLSMHFQIDGQNLTNVVDVIDFGGLFSGNAIGPSRSVMMRLATNF